MLSAGTAVSFGTDATKQPYENENAAWFALATISWPILYFIAWKCTNDTNYFKEEHVIPPVHVRKELQIDSPPSETVTPTVTGTEGDTRTTQEKSGL